MGHSSRADRWLVSPLLCGPNLGLRRAVSQMFGRRGANALLHPNRWRQEEFSTEDGLKVHADLTARFSKSSHLKLKLHLKLFIKDLNTKMWPTMETRENFHWRFQKPKIYTTQKIASFPASNSTVELCRIKMWNQINYRKWRWKEFSNEAKSFKSWEWILDKWQHQCSFPHCPFKFKVTFETWTVSPKIWK